MWYLILSIPDLFCLSYFVINSLFNRGLSYCLSRGPCSSMEIDSTCDFQEWGSEPQVPLMEFINTSEIEVMIRECGYACIQQQLSLT